MTRSRIRAIGRYTIMVLAVLLFSIQRVSAITLSDSARISLITCAPGQELYSCFGHSAIRITDYKQGFDFVFNYGTFDFEQPNFYLNFVRGHMIYMLGVDRFEDFRLQYLSEQRSIIEQEVNLSNEDQKRVFDFLSNNAKEENRSYRYDFLFDNCSTRIRDVFEKNVKGIHFDYSTFTEKKSFRDLINDYSEQAPWSQFGMNLLIGLPVDRQATPAQMCFLPDYLSRGFDHATINGKPLCQKIVTILSIPEQKQEVAFIDKITPVVVFGLLLVLFLIIGYVEFKQQQHYYWIDYVLLFAVGLMGTLFFVIGNFTEHTTTQWDLNIIWALPTHLIMGFVLPFRKHTKWVLNYFFFSAIICMIMIVGWKIMPQKFLFANILIAAIMAIRCYSIYAAPKPRS
jgi:Domain of unknown function (DUF4105)